MTRAGRWLVASADAVILAVADLIARALNHTTKEPW